MALDKELEAEIRSIIEKILVEKDAALKEMKKVLDAVVEWWKRQPQAEPPPDLRA